MMGKNYTETDLYANSVRKHFRSCRNKAPMDSLGGMICDELQIPLSPPPVHYNIQIICSRRLASKHGRNIYLLRSLHCKHGVVNVILIERGQSILNLN